MRYYNERHHDRRGATLLLFAVALVALLGMGALAIDVGMLLKVRAEAQRAADAGALAGASAFLGILTASQATDTATLRAKQVAGANTMAGTAVDTASEVTVTVIPDSFKVRVRVRRAAVPIGLARIFSYTSFPVGARSAAQASGAGASECVQPIMAPDFWDEKNSKQDANKPPNRWPDSGEDWVWDPTKDKDVYTPAGLDGSGTGLGSDWRNGTVLNAKQYYRDVGRPYQLWPGIFAKNSFRSEWCLDGTKCGGNEFPAWITTCDPDLDPTQLGKTYINKPGNTTGKVTAGYEARLARLDPTGATWVETTKLVGGVNYTSGFVQTLSGFDWRNSPRVILVPQANPEWIKNGRDDVQFNNFAWFWIESFDKKDLVVRFIGPATGGLGGPTTGALLKVIRLVE